MSSIRTERRARSSTAQLSALEEAGELFCSFTSKKKAQLAEALLEAHMERHMNDAEHGMPEDFFDVHARAGSEPTPGDAGHDDEQGEPEEADVTDLTKERPAEEPDFEAEFERVFAVLRAEGHRCLQ